MKYSKIDARARKVVHQFYCAMIDAALEMAVCFEKRCGFGMVIDIDDRALAVAVHALFVEKVKAPPGTSKSILLRDLPDGKSALEILFLPEGTTRTNSIMVTVPS